MMRDTVTTTWERWPELARVLHLADRHLDLSLAPAERALALATLAYRHFDVLKRPPDALTRLRLRDAWDAPRTRRLPPRRKQLLLFITGAALALRQRSAEEATALLRDAWILSRLTWWPAEPLPAGHSHGPRVPLAFHRPPPSEEGESPDPSGDPVPERPQTVPEPLPAHSDHGWVRVDQVLEDLDAWLMVLQDLFELPLGRFSGSEIPDLSHLSRDLPTARPSPPSTLDSAWQLFLEARA